MTDMLTSIAHCLQAPVNVPETSTFEAWTTQWFDVGQASTSPIELAIRTAFASDRIAWVFASAYQSALHALIPGTKPGELLTLCVTEQTGNRPRDIRTRIDTLADGSLSIKGNKRWAMIGNSPTTLLVVGVTNQQGHNGTPSLRVIKVQAGSPGLSIAQAQTTRFIPEVPHCALEINDVELGPDALLPGDGYLHYVKPFRTLEDVYVSAATMAYLLREARAHRWPTDYIERLAATLTTLHAIALQPPLEVVTHILLSGALQNVASLRAEATLLWEDAGDACAQRWQRDCALFDVADTARRMRRDRAWEQLRER